MSLPVLYSFRRCPFAIRARMAMAQASQDWQHREVHLKDKPEAMIAVSRKGTVPVLVLDDGTVIDESMDIMLWALRRSDPDGWLAVELPSVLVLVLENDYIFKRDLDRYKYHVRYPEHDREYYRQRGECFLRKLESLLAEQQGGGLFTPRPSLVDVAIFPFIRQFAGVDRKWFDNAGYTNLSQWLVDWEKSDEFLGIMQKHAFWKQ